MPTDPVALFRTLLEQSPTDSTSLDRVITDLTRQGFRRKAIRCSRMLRRRKLDTVDSIKAELINLLSLGKNTRAHTLLNHYKDDLRLAPSFKWMIDRYINRASLEQEVSQTIDATRQALIAAISQNKQKSSYLHKISGFSDYIIISNSNQLRFNKKEKEMLKRMERPLFIYQNIGNPSILPIRNAIYNQEAKELVIGGFKNLYTSTGELFFQPWTASQFLGALTRVNPSFLATWENHLSEPIRRINQPHAINELNENLLIDSLYPLTLFSTNGVNKRRLCTIGWISLCLFDAIAHASRPHARLWSAGFNMSASYVFESCDSLYFHDYPFEKMGLEHRIANSHLTSIGSTDSLSPEASTTAHLSEAGIKSEKLADFKKRTGDWPELC